MSDDEAVTIAEMRRQLADAEAENAQLARLLADSVDRVTILKDQLRRAIVEVARLRGGAS